MVSHDLPCSTVTNQIAFDQRDTDTILEFERAMDRPCLKLKDMYPYGKLAEISSLS